eukprot:3848064-Amphidinium_carterae.1
MLIFSTLKSTPFASSKSHTSSRLNILEVNQAWKAHLKTRALDKGRLQTSTSNTCWLHGCNRDSSTSISMHCWHAIKMHLLAVWAPRCRVTEEGHTWFAVS